MLQEGQVFRPVGNGQTATTRLASARTSSASSTPWRRGVLELVFVLPTTQRVVGSDDQVELLVDRVDASRSLDSGRMFVKMS